ncbi:MAG TPA: WG repeat-containing protein [Chryseolinea sp.]|nr:WG repeat-containing protein [Chryseolinea sp.]
MKKKSLLVLCMLLLAGSSFAQTYVTQVKPAGDKKWGYANLNGEIIIPAQYEKCYEFSSDGLAIIYDSKAKQHHFINLKGEKLPTEVSKFNVKEGFLGFELQGFHDGMLPIRVGEKWGFISSSGKMAIQAKYDDVSDFYGGFAVVKSGEKYIVLNTSGEETPVEGSGLLDVNHFTEGMAPFRAADKKFGFIDTSGKPVIKAQFESVGYFSDGVAWAKSADEKVGYLDKSGAWVIKPQFDAGKNFDQETGLARVKIGKDWVYVSKTGSKVTLSGTDIYEDFADGLARGRQGGKFGWLNSKGEWVIKPQYDGSRDFKNGYAAIQKGKLWGIIDKDGKVVIEPKFDGIKDMELVK